MSQYILFIQSQRLSLLGLQIFFQIKSSLIKFLVLQGNSLTLPSFLLPLEYLKFFFQINHPFKKLKIFSSRIVIDWYENGFFEWLAIFIIRKAPCTVLASFEKYSFLTGNQIYSVTWLRLFPWFIFLIFSKYSSKEFHSELTDVTYVVTKVLTFHHI